MPGASDHDDLRVTFITAFWHPKFGLVLWHTNEIDEPFVMWMPSLPEERAQQATLGYARELMPATLGDVDASLN